MRIRIRIVGIFESSKEKNYFKLIKLKLKQLERLYFVTVKRIRSVYYKLLKEFDEKKKKSPFVAQYHVV